MKARSIILSSAEVRGILDGSVSHLARVVTDRSPVDGDRNRNLFAELDLAAARVDPGPSPAGNVGPYLKAPRREADTVHRVYPGWLWTGAALWVREVWAAHWMYDYVAAGDARSTHPDDNTWYRADGDDAPGSRGCPAKGRRGQWRTAGEMPRWASRISLVVDSVRLLRAGDADQETLARADIAATPDTWIEMATVSRVESPTQSPEAA